MQGDHIYVVEDFAVGYQESENQLYFLTILKKPLFFNDFEKPLFFNYFVVGYQESEPLK
jgi:hypothetical protein